MAKTFKEMNVKERYEFVKAMEIDFSQMPDVVKYERTLSYSGTLQAIDKIDFTTLIPDKAIAGKIPAWLKLDIDMELSADPTEALQERIISHLSKYPSADISMDTKIKGEKFRIQISKVKDVKRLTLEERIEREKVKLTDLMKKQNDKGIDVSTED